MQRYKITMVLELDEEASQARHFEWLAETIYDALQDGEDLVEIHYEEVVDTESV